VVFHFCDVAHQSGDDNPQGRLGYKLNIFLASTYLNHLQKSGDFSKQKKTFKFWLLKKSQKALDFSTFSILIY